MLVLIGVERGALGNWKPCHLSLPLRFEYYFTLSVVKIVTME